MLSSIEYPRYGALLMPQLEGVDQHQVIYNTVIHRDIWFPDEGSYTICKDLHDIAFAVNQDCICGLKINAISVPEVQPSGGAPIYKLMEKNLFDFCEGAGYWLRYNDGSQVYGWNGNRIFDITIPQVKEKFIQETLDICNRLHVNYIMFDEMQFSLGYLPRANQIRYRYSNTSWEDATKYICRQLKSKKPNINIIPNGATVNPAPIIDSLYIQNSMSNIKQTIDRALSFINDSAIQRENRNIILENPISYFDSINRFFILASCFVDARAQISNHIFNIDPIVCDSLIAVGLLGKPMEYASSMSNEPVLYWIGNNRNQCIRVFSIKTVKLNFDDLTYQITNT